MFFLALFAILSVTVANSEINSEIISKEHLQNLIFKIINEPKPNFEPCTENLIKKALFGDLIEIKRKGYFHWCVFVSEAAVIQLNNPEFEKLNPENAFENFTGNVEFRNLFELAGSDLCRINNKKNESVRKGLHTRNDSEIAQKMIEELKNNVTSYNVFSKNCEHFATNLRFGVSFSSQIEALKRIAEKEEYGDIASKMFKVAAMTAQPPAQDFKEGLAVLEKIIASSQ